MGATSITSGSQACASAFKGDEQSEAKGDRPAQALVSRLEVAESVSQGQISLIECKCRGVAAGPCPWRHLTGGWIQPCKPAMVDNSQNRGVAVHEDSFTTLCRDKTTAGRAPWREGTPYALASHSEIEMRIQRSR